jgi:hypothetical protein
MLLVKSNTSGTVLNTQNMQETYLYLNISYICWLHKSCASKQKHQSVFFSYLKCNFSSVFKIIKHKFNNCIFSINPFEFKFKFWYFSWLSSTP